MQRNSVDVNNIEKTSHPESMFSSFKITIPVVGSDKVFEKSFWPYGVRCQKWFDRSSRNYESDNESDDDSDNSNSENPVNNLTS